VRRALSPLVETARVTDSAFVAIMHPNKGSSTNALARIADSGAFTALARSVLLMGPDPADADGERGSDKVLALPRPIWPAEASTPSRSGSRPPRFGPRTTVRSRHRG
jgi:hypothetical protein